MRFSAKISVLVLTTSLSFAVTAVAQHPYPANYKGEANYKNELPTEPLYPCTNEAILKDGFYLGAGAGYDAYKFNLKVEGIDDFGNAVTLNPAFAANGWKGSLFAGYGQYFNWFYIGGEIVGMGASATNSTTFAANLFSLKEELRVRQTYGVGLLPGVKVNDYALIYGRLGYLRSSVRSTETASVVGLGSVSTGRTDWLNGFNYGVGIETSIYENTSVRGEYTYTSYGSFNNDGTVFDPSNNSFTLSIVYHFTC